MQQRLLAKRQQGLPGLPYTTPSYAIPSYAIAHVSTAIEGEVVAIAVGAQIEVSGKVLYLVLMTPLTGHEAAHFGFRNGHGQEPALAGQGAIEGNEEILLGAAQLDGDIKALVCLGKDQPITAHRGAESMIPHLAGTQCLLVQPHIIKGGAIRRPDHIARAIFDQIR